MNRRRRPANRPTWAACIAITLATVCLVSMTIILIQQNRATDKTSNVNINICHISDFHAAVERRADRQYEECSDSGGFALSKMTMIKHILDKNCDLKLFTGDLMHGGDYDLLDALAPQQSIAHDLLPYWSVDAWTFGNHELGPFDGEVTEVEGRRSPPPLISSNVISSIYNSVPYKKIVTARGADICLYGLIDPDLVEGPADLHIARDVLESYQEAYLASKKSGCHKSHVLRILLSHQGWKKDLEFVGKELGAGAPDLVLGAHSHNLLPGTYPFKVNDTVISHVGAYGGWVGILNFGREETEGKIEYYPYAEKTGRRPLWKWSLNSSRLVSTRYQVNRGTPQRSSTSLKPPKDEAEHGYYLRQLPEGQRFENTVEHSVELSPHDFDYLCENDKQMLSQRRETITELVSNLTRQVVADLPGNFKEKSISCRYGHCLLGKWIGLAAMLTPTAASKISIDCGHEGLGHILPNTTRSLREIKTVLGVVQGGVLRSEIPPVCESVFEKKTGGCDIVDQLDLYDIERILPFHNKVRMTVLKSPSTFCQMIHRIVDDWLQNDGSARGMLHFGNAEYFLFKEKRTAKGRRPMFDHLWQSNTGFIGAEIMTLKGQKVRGVCSTEDKWTCLEPNCEEQLGKILILGPDILLRGADGGIFDWYQDADLEYLTAVASRLVDDQHPGCWFSGLSNFTMNDAAALFLNSTLISSVLEQS